MIAETGHYALILALGVAIVQTVLPLLACATRSLPPSPLLPRRCSSSW
jgi:cytochrome c biogenesis factor